MAEMKLYYFPGRLRAEFIRLMYVAAGKKFEDNIVTPGTEWPAKKTETPYGQLPYMVYKGKVHGQCVAIANFVAREFGFYGKTNQDALRIDEVVQLSEEIKDKVINEFVLAKGDDKKAEGKRKFNEEYFPRLFGFYEKLLTDNGSNGFFVGKALTLADFQAYDLVATALGWNPKAIDAFPNLKKLCSNVEAVPVIKKYLASRPQRPV